MLSLQLIGFYDFLWSNVDQYTFEPLKCLMTSGSFKSIETIDSFFMWVSFLVLLFMYL